MYRSSNSESDSLLVFKIRFIGAESPRKILFYSERTLADHGTLRFSAPRLQTLVERPGYNVSMYNRHENVEYAMYVGGRMHIIWYCVQSIASVNVLIAKQLLLLFWHIALRRTVTIGRVQSERQTTKGCLGGAKQSRKNCPRQKLRQTPV